ncbi:MAG TPA: right-handed parallel beta-helix repeat-containing protein, partial [Myxococcota bacterium]
MRTSASLAAIVVSLSASASARADVAPTRVVQVGDDLAAALRGLVPGDVVALAPGTHTVTSRLGLTATGTAAAPITITSLDPDDRALIVRPNADQNVIDVDVGHFVVLDSLRISGGSRGIRLNDVSDFTITNSEVFETGDVAVSANDGDRTYARLTLTHNELHDTHGTGEGFYLGCNGDSCRLTDSVIANNWIHDLDSDDVEQGDGIEVKVGSFGNVIRDNVVHDTNFPCITLYGTLGNGADNQIVGNLLFRCGDNGIQVAADAIVHNNVIVSVAVDGIHTQNHDGAVPGNLDIRHNTIATAGDALALRQVAGPIVVANNALYSAGANAVRVNGNAAQVAFFGNVGAGGLDGAAATILGAGVLAADTVDASGFDLFPIEGGGLDGTGSLEHIVAVDFNGTPRTTADVGAYVVAASNPRAFDEE